MKNLKLLPALIAMISLSGCPNLYKVVDKPSGDAQILSAARAAFDRGDIQEARDLYAKLGSNETAIAETVYTNIDDCGGGIEAVGAALGAATTGSAGVILTVMGEKMNARRGTACFATLLAAYRTTQTLTDVTLKNFSGFLAALAIAGEVLANNSGITNTGSLAKTDIVSNGTTCVSGSCGACAVTSKGITYTAAANINTGGDATITATSGTLHAAMLAANTALTNLGISAGPSSSLIAALKDLNPAVADSNALGYSCALNSIGVGR